MELNSKKKRVELVLGSGVIVWVTPLSRYAFQAIIDKGRELYPLPDETEFDEKHPEGVPGAVIPGKENPEYIKQLGRATGQQNEHIMKSILKLAIEFPIYEDVQPTGEFYTHDELIDRFAYRRKELASIMTLPDDTWQATFEFCILGGTEDETQIVNIANDELPLTPAEVERDIRLFRPYLSREKLRTLAKLAASRSKAKPVQNKA